MKSRYGTNVSFAGLVIRTSRKIARSDHVRVVRAQREADQDLVTETDVGDLDDGEGVAVLGGREDVGATLAFELDDVRPLDRHLLLLGDRSLGAAELERGQAIAVDDAVDVRRVGVLVRPDHPAGLAMRIHALAEELDARLQDEVPGHALPDEVELVALAPTCSTPPAARAYSWETAL